MINKFGLFGSGNTRNSGFHMFDNKQQEEFEQSTTKTDLVWQRTLKSSVSCTSVGVHSGENITINLKPAAVDTGVTFIRTDVDGDGVIPARWDRVVDTRMCSVIANDDGASVGTIEHLMAALAGCGVDNIEIEIDGGEVPIMDGSSEPFVALIKEVGVVEQDAPRRVIRVLKEVSIECAGGRASLAPSDMQVIDFEIEFDSKAINHQALETRVINGAFCKELSQARTFGFLHEVEALRNAGLAKGGSLDNAIVVDEDRILNEGGLRFDDEFVRHKALDAIGDLFLAGAPVIGRFKGVCSGHAANNQLLHALFADDDAWCWDVLAGDAVRHAVDGGIEAEQRI